MCGLFGVVCREEALTGLRGRLEDAKRCQIHRGPDMQTEEVVTVGSSGFVVFMAHQRLSILDLSEAGRQPMHDRDRSSWIAYNGEVYNYVELAADMQYVPIGGSDTEVVLEAFRRDGVEASVPKFNGMWALSWISLKENKLYLSRDRAGVKPLYVARSEGAFFFASEIKTLLALMGRKLQLNLQVVGEYLAQSLQDTSTATFFDGITAISPGSVAVVDLDDQLLPMVETSFWQPLLDDKNAKESDSNEIEQLVRQQVMDAVRLRLRSDVPVGVLLSGGLDSSIIAACIKQLLPQDHKNVTVLSAVSPGKPGDESKFIDMVAEHLDIRPIKVSTAWGPEQALELLRRVSYVNDAPLGSFSNVAFYLLMEKAKANGIKVILSGQGGDELFCGYRKYLGFHLEELVRNGSIPKAVAVAWKFLRSGVGFSQFNLAEAARYLRRTPKNTILGSAVLSIYKPLQIGRSSKGLAHRQWLDYRNYSVPYLTHYEDRCSMAFGREIRLPFLDYRLVQLMLNAPDNAKLDDGWTKISLRRAFRSLLPKEIVWRRDKQGFSLPQEEWLRGELKSAWLEILNEDAQVFKRGLVNREKLLNMFDSFCARRGNIWYREIFAPLALEIWLQEYSMYIE